LTMLIAFCFVKFPRAIKLSRADLHVQPNDEQSCDSANSARTCSVFQDWEMVARD